MADFFSKRNGSGSEILSSSFNALLLICSWYGTSEMNPWFLIIMIYSITLFIIYYEIKKNIDDSMILSWNIGYLVFVVLGCILAYFYPKILKSFGKKIKPQQQNIEIPRSKQNLLKRMTS